jgi:hypothetical protein
VQALRFSKPVQSGDHGPPTRTAATPVVVKKYARNRVAGAIV